jgi:hypothetical protein
MFAKRSGLSRGNGLILAGCLFVLVHFTGQAFAAPDKPSETDPPSCAVVNKVPAKAKPQVQAPAKANTQIQTPSKANPQVQAPAKANPGQAPLKSKTTTASRGKLTSRSEERRVGKECW